MMTFKRGSRDVTRAALSLRWSVMSLLKCPFKDNKYLSIQHFLTLNKIRVQNVFYTLVFQNHYFNELLIGTIVLLSNQISQTGAKQSVTGVIKI